MSIVSAHHHHPPPPHSRSPEQISLSRLLRGRHLSLRHLKQVHCRIFRLRLHCDNILAAMLLSSLSSSGSISYALRLLLSLPSPDLVLLNSMLKALALSPRHCPQALSFFLLHLLPDFRPDCFTLPYVLKACASLNHSSLASQIHAFASKCPDLREDPFVLNSLVDAYFKCNLPGDAAKVFRRMPSTDAAAWNILLAGMVGKGDLEGALEVFGEMPERDVVSWNTVLSAYVRAGDMASAQRVFDEMPERNLVSWNGLIAGFLKSGRSDKAVAAFTRMLGSGMEPDESTILSISSACNSGGFLDDDAVDRIANLAMKMNSVNVSTALVSIYCRAGRTREARDVFDRIPEKDIVAWNSMMGGYSQNQRPAEAIELFHLMQKENGVRPDGITMASLIDACSQMGALELGDWIHAYIQKNMIEMDSFLATALIDMYAKCGDLNRSQALFSAMPEKDLPSWNAMIKGLAVHGQGYEALRLFSVMDKDGVKPNEITFVGLLSACSHDGLVAEGLEIFDEMQTKFGIVPRVEHYGCIVDLLGRAGRLHEAFDFTRSMPMKPDLVIWGSLLSAARFYRNVELAEEAASRLMELEPAHDGNYVLLSNVYASVGKWAGVEKVRALMRSNEVTKAPGCSAVELDGVIHEFTAGDRSHPRSSEIYAAWDDLVKILKPMGYKPDTSAQLKNLDEEDKEEALYRHSEKLALSFALINSSANTPIRIVKNLRICTDCHRAMELVSQLKQRDIVVRDRNRFHHFSQGSCSCRGFW